MHGSAGDPLTVCTPRLEAVKPNRDNRGMVLSDVAARCGQSLAGCAAGWGAAPAPAEYSVHSFDS